MRNKVNRSQVCADSAEMALGFNSVSQPSLGSGISNLTTNTPQLPDESTPLSLELNSENVTKNSASAAHVRLADFAIKHKKLTLTGLLFLVFSICGYAFLLGRQGVDYQLQRGNSNLMKLLALDENVLSNMTMEDKALLQDMKLLLERVNEKDNIISNMRDEKVELVGKVAHLTEENRWLKDENDKIMEIMASAETDTVQHRPTKCNCSTRFMSSEVTCVYE
mmetsp:Transcript_17606/g.38129  ORF Transcript_17606/g.38129 Transcript_17606/m.38129 type:complete len:222 (+) Transcript_17606:53-718(+)